MDIILYNSSSDRRRLNKHLSGGDTRHNVHLKDDTSITDPTFEMKLNGHIGAFNFLYCPDLNRYYFVEKITKCRGGILEIKCHVDVLMSYADELYAHKAYVVRSERKFFNENQDQNGIFFDTEYPIRTDSYIWTEEVLEFGCVTNLKSYYLTVNGGIL